MNETTVKAMWDSYVKIGGWYPVTQSKVVGERRSASRH